jgi:hypothetical protein
MELHSEPGTQRLELPVSRMTLNSWGGVPMAISEKSVFTLAQFIETEDIVHTLSVQEVADGNGVTAVRLDGGVSEHLINVLSWANAHVFLSKSSGVNIHVGMLLRRIKSVNNVMENLYIIDNDKMVDLPAAQREGSSGASSCGYQPRRYPAA